MKFPTLARLVIVLRRLLQEARSIRYNVESHNGANEDGGFDDIRLTPPPEEIPEGIMQQYDVVEADGRRGLFYDTQGQHRRRRPGLGDRWAKLVHRTKDFFG